VFHAGDGNLHPLILYDGREDGALEQAEQLAGDILRMCIRLGGSITGEHGVGLEKRSYLKEMFGPDDMEFMGRIREAVDPEQLANRGKVLAAAEAPALASHGPHPLEKEGIIFRE
jgi:glycolate oxidase